MIENNLANDWLWEPPRKRLLECGCIDRCNCDDYDEEECDD